MKILLSTKTLSQLRIRIRRKLWQTLWFQTSISGLDVHSNFFSTLQPGIIACPTDNYWSTVVIVQITLSYDTRYCFLSFGVLGFFSFFLISSIYVAIEIIMSPQTSSTKILKGSSTLKTHSVPLPEGSKCCLALYREGRSTSHSTDIWTGSTMLQSLWKNYFLFFIHLFVHISLKTASQINQIRKA